MAAFFAQENNLSMHELDEMMEIAKREMKDDGEQNEL
jgi:hypothetical protein